MDFRPLESNAEVKAHYCSTTNTQREQYDLDEAQYQDPVSGQHKTILQVPWSLFQLCEEGGTT